ncbi:MAG: Crp/Fnr family transcriptional regulator [Thiohalocapsa sp.]|jgi:CRP/FNR family cyclic AMP-dependent transcriptional regulator|nr:Crp/Fnr family transcriptional regulator [Thiohalocapsa sp.]MCF7989404.1 Crp/Fnr family transcriptional regulator [Thiohalocapsa sp.]
MPPPPNTPAGEPPTLRSVPFFASLDEADLKAIESQTKIKRYRKKTIIIEKGDESSSLYLLLDGRAKVYVADDAGKEVVLRELGPGDHFGELALLSGSPRTASVMTLTDCELCLLTGAVFRGFLLDHPEAALRLIRELALQVASLTDMVSDMALLSVYGRVAKVLVESAKDEDGRSITAPLTHQGIADRVGCSREMVSRIIGDLKTGGYVAMEGKRFVLQRKLPERW